MAIIINDSNLLTPFQYIFDEDVLLNEVNTISIDEPTANAIIDITISVDNLDGVNGDFTITKPDNSVETGVTTITFSGTQAEINAALLTLKFSPNLNYNGSETLNISATSKVQQLDTNGNPVFDINGDPVYDIIDTVNQGIDISITPINDDPVLTPTAPLSVAEGEANVAFSDAQFGLVDPDIATGQQEIQQQIVSIVSIPTHGELRLNGNILQVGSVFSYNQLANLTYTHNGTDVSPGDTDVFTVKVNDGGGGESPITQINIDLTPVNQAPTVGGGIAILEGSVNNQIPVLINLGDNADTPATATVNVVSVSNQGQGTLYLDLNDNGIVDSGEVLVAGSTFSGAQANLVKFNHNGNEPTLTPPLFVVNVTDAGGGTGIPLTSANIPIVITVNPVDDDPTLGVNETLTVTGAGTEFITNSFLRVDDVDSENQNLVYSLDSRPTKGVLQLNVGVGGVDNWVNLGIGGLFTQEQINEGKIRYVHEVNSANLTDTDSFSFVVRDSALRTVFPIPNEEGGIRTTFGQPLQVLTFNINIDTPSNATGTIPSGTTPGYGGNTGTRPENSPQLDLGTTFTKNNSPQVPNEGGFNVITTEMLNYRFVNSGVAVIPDEQVVYTLKSLPNNVDSSGPSGLFKNGVRLVVDSTFTQQDINDGLITFVHNDSEIFISSFDYSVSFGGEVRIDDTFGIDVTPVNDAPTASGGSSVTLQEGEVTTITTAQIILNDVDGVGSDKNTGFAAINTLEFQVITLPTRGTLFIDNNGDGIVDSGEAITAGQWISQQDLIDGKIKYRHDGTENFIDGFSMKARDNWGAESGTADINIDIFPVNDAPQVPLTPDAPDITINDPLAGEVGTTKNDPLTVNEGGTGTITNILLQAVDPDNNTTQRQYRITTRVTNGTLLLNGKALGVGSTFTQKDIDDGKLTYKHNGSENFTDSFRFTVSDGVATTAIAQFDINVTPLNDRPTLVTTTRNFNLDSTNALPITGISVGDVDLLNIAPGETDRIRVTLDPRLIGSIVTYTAGTLNLVNTTGITFVEGTNNTSGNKLVIEGTLASINAALASLTYQTSIDLNNTVNLNITVDDRLRDGSGNVIGANGGLSNQNGNPLNDTNNTATRVIRINVSTVNDDPIITVPVAQTVNEDTPLSLAGITVTDPDVFDSDNNTVTVSVLNGNLSLTDTSLITGGVNGSNTITLTGSFSAIDAALNGLSYQGNPDFNGSDTLTVTATDLGSVGSDGINTETETVGITVTPVNDAPVLTVPGSPFNLVGGVNNIALSGVSFTDIKDVSQGASDTFSVTIVAPSVGDTLAAAIVGSATSVYDTVTRTLTLTGNTTDVNATLANLVYTPVNPNSDSTVTLAVTVNDGGNGDEGGTNTGNQTVTGNLTVRISNTNDAPVNILPIPLTVLEDSSNNPVTGIQIDDPDDFGGNLTVVLRPTNGTINFSGTPTGVTVTGAGTNASPYTLVGSESAINAYLNTLRFTPTGNLHGAEGIASIRVTTTDTPLAGSGSPQTDTDDYPITITPRNDRPTASSNVNLSPTNASTEDEATQPSVVINTLNFGYNDNTDNRTSITNSITGVPGGDTSTPFSYIAIRGNTATAAQGTWQVSDGSGGWIIVPTTGLSNTSALIFPSDREIRFVPAPNFHGTPGNLSVRLADGSMTLPVSTSAGDFYNLTQVPNGSINNATGSWNNTNRTIATTVTNVNDRPSATDTTIAGGTEDNPTSALTITGTAFGYSDATDDRTSITGGVNAATAFGGIAIVGNGANSVTEGVWQYSTDNGTTWVDVGTPSDNSALILPVNAQLQFVPSANFNGTPGQLNIRVADTSQIFSGNSDITANLNLGTSGSDSNWSTPVTLSAPITKLNDAPVVTATINNPTATENNDTGTGFSVDPVNLFSGASISDIDLTTTSGLSSNIFGAGTITVTLTDGIVGDILQVNGALPPGVNITGGTGNNSLIISLDNDTTLAEVENIINNIQYRSSSDDPTLKNTDTSRNYTLIVSDGNNAQAGGNAGGATALNSNTLTGTININAVNDAPVLDTNVNPVLSSTEDNPSPVGAVGSLISDFVGGISDVDSLNNGIAITSVTTQGTLWYSTDNGNNWSPITSVSDSNALLLANDANTRLYFQPNVDLNGTVNSGMTFRAWDQSQGSNGQFFDITTNTGTGGISPFSSATDTIAINIIAVNDAPIASGSTTLLPIDEDSTNPGGNTVNSLFTGNFNDNTDNVPGGSTANNLAGVAIVGNVANPLTEGTWEYFNGTTWVSVGTPSVNNALIVASTDSLRFVPVADYNGSAAALTVHLIDSSITVTTGSPVNLSGVSATGGTTAYSVNTVNLTSNVIPINDAPTLVVPPLQTLSSGTNITFSQANGNQITIDDLKDLNNNGVDNFTVTLTVTDGVNPYGTLTLATTSGLTVNGDGTATITLTGTKDDINNALNGLVYTPVNANAELAVNLNVLVNDLGNGSSTVGQNPLTVTNNIPINISNINEAPIVTNPITVTATEDTIFSFTNSNLISFDDPDDFGSDLEVTLSVTNGTLTFGTIPAGLSFTTGDGVNDKTFVFRGTELEINTALASLTYLGDPDYNNLGTSKDVLSLTIDDLGNTGTIGGVIGASNIVNRNIDISVTPVNDAPIAIPDVTIPGVAQNNTNPPPNPLPTLLSANYDDSKDQVSGGSSSTPLRGIAIVGNNADPVQGKWQYSLSTLSVESWNDVPTSGLSASSALVLNNLASVKLRFLPDPTFNGTPTNQDLEVYLSDGLGFSSSANVNDRKDITADISNPFSGWSNSSIKIITSINTVTVNTPPIINDLDGDIFAVAPNGTTKIDQGTLATITDTQGLKTGGQLTISLNGFGVSTNGETLSIDPSFLSGIGTIDPINNGTNGQPLTITFTKDLTVAEGNTLIQNITYQANAIVGIREASFTVTDGQGGTSNTATAFLNVTTTSNPYGPAIEGDVNGQVRSDILKGTNFNDIINGKGSNDILYGYNGDDLMMGGDANDRLDAGAGNDVLLGGGGNDILLGGNDNDILLGGDGNDNLNGGNGNDYLSGGLGADTLTGGAGVDMFDYSSLKDSFLGTVSTKREYDLITDFNVSQGDKILTSRGITSLNTTPITITALTHTVVESALSSLGVDSATLVKFGTRTFLAINDDKLGFEANNDIFIEFRSTGTLSTDIFSPL